MARLYELAHDASTIREQYGRIHESAFALRLPGFRKRESYADLTQQLAEVGSQLAEIERSVDALSPEELTKRGAKQIHATLLAYTRALAESVAGLAKICLQLDKEQQGLPGYSRYSSADLRGDKIAYDDSIQEYRRHGAALQQLFDKF